MADPNPPLWWIIVTLPIVAVLYVLLLAVEGINAIVRVFRR